MLVFLFIDENWRFGRIELFVKVSVFFFYYDVLLG